MEDYKGLKWYKCDLHLHTPKSKCFIDECTPEEYINKVKEKGLDVIAITDHNSPGWIDELKPLAKENNIIIFPGVEITVGESHSHLLVLFDVDKNSKDIERFLMTKLGLSDLEFGKDSAKIDKKILEVIEEIKKENLLVIPAHIDDFSGISQVNDEDIRKDILNDENINAVQVVYRISNEANFLTKESYAEIENKRDDRNFKKISNTINQVNKCNISKLTFSDNPHPNNSSKHGLDGIGNSYSWIKMKEKPNLESLRQALIMGKERIKNIFETEKKPYRLPDIWIEKIKFSNTELNKDSIEVDFSPQMTSIVGGRGTGKSSIINIIRGILNKKPNIKKIEDDFNSFYKINKSREGILNKDTKIELLINMNQEKYKIIKENFQNNKEFEDIIVLKKDSMGEYQKCDIEDILERFEIEIFSQKEIFEISNESNSLLEIIDKSISEISEKKQEIKKLKAEYKMIYSKLEKIKSQEKDIKTIENDIKFDKEKLEKIDNKNYKELLEKQKIFNNEQSILEKLKKKYQDIFDNMNFSFEEEQEEIVNSDIKEIYVKYFETIKKHIENIEFIKQKIEEDEKNFEEEILKSNWKKNFLDNKTKLEQEEEKIKLEAGTLDIKEIREKISKNEENLEEYKREIEKKDELEKKLKSTFDLILTIRNEIKNIRETHLKESLEGLDVRINIDSYRNKEDFEKQFRELIGKTKEFSSDIDKIVEDIFKGKFLEKRVLFIEKIKNIKNEKENDLHNNLIEIIKGFKNEKMADIELLLPEDQVIVKYKQNDGGFKPLKTASAGQKTSAILTYILSREKNPLILDQPEDDLDNELIYNLIVKSLKNSKNKRQIIVVTHNANIPVNGDSEYIVVMDSTSKEVKQLVADSIDDEEIVKSICNIMEGGKPAFDLRNKKYKINRVE
jgi:DNA repair ATPase RecN